MIKYRIILSIALVAGGCKWHVSSSSTKDQGTVNAGVSAVAVYEPNHTSGKWEKAAQQIKPQAKVFTVDDANGQPKLFSVSMPGQKLKLNLVEVVFQNQGEAQWTRGYVLLHCFSWDKSKHVSQTILNQAVESSAQAKPSSDTNQPARHLCGT